MVALSTDKGSAARFANSKHYQLLQLATRYCEYLTNSQTGLTLFPKNKRVQAVFLHRAGFC